jgi:signal transduction histidine kinase
MAELNPDELERARLASLAEFAAGAGHEINNPLGVITGRVQLLLRDEHDPERRRELAIIHTQALRIREMIADLMFFARPPAPQRRTCDAGAIVDAAVAGLSPKPETLRVSLSRVGTTAPVEISVDAEQWQAALRAVIDNALNAAEPGGKIEVELRASTEAVEFIVRDDGPGIPADVRPHLFDPFYSGREAGRGLGMGLPKAWRIVTEHGGTVAVESTSPRGATFVIRLPIAPPTV